MARHLVRDRDAEMEASISSSSTKRPKRGQKAVVYQLERNGPPLNPRPTGLAGLNEFERANQAPKQVPLPQLTESDSVDNTSVAVQSVQEPSTSGPKPMTAAKQQARTFVASAAIAVPPSYTRNARKAIMNVPVPLQIKLPAKPAEGVTQDASGASGDGAPQLGTTTVLSTQNAQHMSLSDVSFSSSSLMSSSSSITSFAASMAAPQQNSKQSETTVTADEVSSSLEKRDESHALTLSSGIFTDDARCAVIKFWNEKLEGVEVVTKSAFLKALKAEVKVHPYILLFLTYTLCGREGIVNLSLTKGFLDAFGVGEVNLSERVVRITSSLIHSTTGAHGWFWGFLQQEDVDKVLKDAVHDGSFLIRVNHRKPGTLSLSYVSWLPLGCNANTVKRKVIHTLRVQWDHEEKGFVARFVSSTRTATWKKIGPYATIPHMLAYLSSSNIIGTSFPTSPLSWELRPARFNKKKDGDTATAVVTSSTSLAVASVAQPGATPH